MKGPRSSLDPGRLRARLIAVLTAIMAIAVVMFGLATLSAFDRAIAPELQNRTRLIGSIVRGEIQRVLDRGIPFDALEGLEDYLADTISDFSEINRIAVLQGEGRIIAEVRRPEAASLLQGTSLASAAGIDTAMFSFPILIGNELVGEIQVFGSQGFVETRLRDVFLDVSVLAMVALLLGVELALAVAAASIWKPYGRVVRLLHEQGNGNFVHFIRVSGVASIRRIGVRLNEQAKDLAARIRTLPESTQGTIRRALVGEVDGVYPERMRFSDFSDVRLALFLFATATEITSSFLPVYARNADRPDWLSAELSAAAPLIVYLVGVAALSPFGGALERIYGSRRIFVVSAVPAAVALIGMGIADTLLAVTLWRGLIGVFFALATIACQEYTIRAGGAKEAAQSSSAFVGMIFGGTFCGSVLGGVIGGRYGFPAAMFLGAAMALAAGMVANGSMRGSAGEPAPAARPDRGAASAVQRPQGFAFWALLLFVAIPMSTTTAVFIWYLTPLSLAEQGHDPGTVARVVMLYYLAATLLGPLAKGLMNGPARAVIPVLVGAAVTGGVLVYYRSVGDIWIFLLAVTGCGVGHALVRVPMTTLAVELSRGSRRGLGAFRLGERLGALMGLLASAALLGISETQPALALLGGVSFAGAVLFAIVYMKSGGERAPQS